MQHIQPSASANMCKKVKIQNLKIHCGSHCKSCITHIPRIKVHLKQGLEVAHLTDINFYKVSQSLGCYENKKKPKKNVKLLILFMNDTLTSKHVVCSL